MDATQKQKKQAMKKTYLYLLVGFIALVAFASCERRDLTYSYYPYCDVTISVDWTRAFPANEMPTGMSVWCYPKNGGAPIVNIFNNIDKIDIPLRTGLYDIVVFNQTPAEFGAIGFRGADKIEDVEVYAVEELASMWYASKAESGELILRQPEKFAMVVYRDFEVTKEMIENTRLSRALAKSKANPKGGDTNSKTDTKSHITLYPQRATLDAKIKIRVKGIHNLYSVRAAVSNMAEGYEINKNRGNITPATHIVSESTKQGSYGEGVITMTYTTFGLMGDKDDPSYTSTNFKYWKGKLHLEVLLVDKKTIKEFDFALDDTIVKRIEKKAGEGSPLIELELLIDSDLRLPAIELPDVKPEGGIAGGFDTEVEDWDDEGIVDIPV